MQNNRITREEFITICRANGVKMSQPTLDRHLKDENFIVEVDAKKEMTATSKIPAWTFDREKTQSYKPNKPAKKSVTAIVKAPVQAVAMVQAPARSEKQGIDAQNVLLIPHKIYLTLDEAKLLTGFPKSELRKISELKFGRRVIKKSKLEKI